MTLQRSSLCGTYHLACLLPTQTNIQPPSITEIDGAVGLEPMGTGSNTKQEYKNAAYCLCERRLKTMRAFIGLCPLCLGFLGPCLGWRRKKVFFQPAGASSNLPLSMFSFLSRLIDTPLMQRRSIMSLSTLCGFESPRLLALPFSFCLEPHLSVSPQNRRIWEELCYIQGQLLSPFAKWQWILVY